MPSAPVRKPGQKELQEVQRFWKEASPDARLALLHLTRALAKAEGIGRAERQPGEQRSSSDNA